MDKANGSGLPCAVWYVLCGAGIGAFYCGEGDGGVSAEVDAGGQRFWAIATGVFHLIAGVAIGSSLCAGIAARLLTAMIAVFGLFIWAPALAGSLRDHFVWCANTVRIS